jgi:hypothetical protein
MIFQKQKKNKKKVTLSYGEGLNIGVAQFVNKGSLHILFPVLLGMKLI